MRIASALSTMKISRLSCRSFHMLMREQMILAVFVIPVAFRAETELQTRIVKLSPATYRTAVFRSVGILHMRG